MAELIDHKLTGDLFGSILELSLNIKDLVRYKFISYLNDN